MSLDEAAVAFTRRPEVVNSALLRQLAGTYETATSLKFQVVVKQDGGLYLVFSGRPEQQLLPYKGLKFRIKEFPDVVFEFIVENGQTKALKQRDPSGEFIFTRK